MAAVSNSARTAPRRRSSQRGKGPKRRPRWRLRAVLTLVAGCSLWLLWAVAARHLAPTGNTSADHFDAIIVLGSPADKDGNPTPRELARVTEAVHEYERGVAPRMILTGAAVQNGFTEALVMARTAEAQGVPHSSVVVEPEARTTIENACYSARLMKAHGWNSAEVISSRNHLPRAGLIFSRLSLFWRAHPAPLLQPESAMDEAAQDAVETLKTMHYLAWWRWKEPCQP